MTGIKPREMFQDKGMSNEMAEQLKNVQQRVNLIDAISGAGASPLANPLTQFLLQTGANLIGGTAAGGTKLQEIVGATKQPLAAAVKAQQLKDLSRRKIAASLLSKSNIDEARKAYNSYGKAKYKTFEEFLPVYATMKLSTERKPRSAADIAQADKDLYVKDKLSIKDFRDNRIYNREEALKMYAAEQKVKKNKQLIDASNFHLPKKAELVSTGQKTKSGKSVVKPPKGIKFFDEYVYYDVQGPGTYYRYDQDRDILIPLDIK